MRSAVLDSRKTRLKTIVELLVAIPLFVTCLYYYGKWNNVPVHTDKIEVACLKYHQPESDSLSVWNPIAIIKYGINTSKVISSKMRAGDIHKEFDHWMPQKTYNSSNGLSRNLFIRDSIALYSDYWRIARLKRGIILAKLNGSSYDADLNELSAILSSQSNDFNYKAFESHLDSSVEYQTELLELLDEDLKEYYKDSLDLYDRERTIWLDNPTKDIYALYYFQMNSSWNISEHEVCAEGPSYMGSAGGRVITFWGYNDSTYYKKSYMLRTPAPNVTSFSDQQIIETVESPLKYPKWNSKFDISQSYFVVNLKCESIDSVRLTFDFVGATDFSEMIPEPDSINMSSITFSDPHKIMQIKEKGLKFHAHFKERDGLQTIRLFAVTALMCVFTPMIMICVVNVIIILISGIRGLGRLKKIKEETLPTEQQV